MTIYFFFCSSLVECKRGRLSIWICYSLLLLLLLLVKKKTWGYKTGKYKPIYLYQILLAVYSVCPPLLVLYDYRVHWIFFRPPPHPHLIKKKTKKFDFFLQSETKRNLKTQPHFQSPGFLSPPTAIFFFYDFQRLLSATKSLAPVLYSTFCGFSHSNSKHRRQWASDFSSLIFSYTRGKKPQHQKQVIPNYISPGRKNVGKTRSYSFPLVFPLTLTLSISDSHSLVGSGTAPTTPYKNGLIIQDSRANPIPSFLWGV